MTTRLPNVEHAEIPEAKLTGHLLSPDHPRGRSKAAFLARFSFRRDEWSARRDALRTHARSNDVVGRLQTDYGIRYEVDGPLLAPDGRAPFVRVVWFIENGETAPRLVTLVPLKWSRR